MKRLFTSIALVSLAVVSFAGGLLTNTNQSASFVRNPARYASLETDAIYFNPAGTAFFKEGWSFSANWQMIWQQRDAIDRTSGQNTKYEGKVYVPCMPTLMAAYKTGDWTFSAFFGMPGGGGKAEFDNGLPSFYYMANNMFKNMGLPLFNNGFEQTLEQMNANPNDPYVSHGFKYANGGTIVSSVGSQFESTQYLFSLQLGAAYKITDNLSAYAGVRANYINNNYTGTIFGEFEGTANVVNLDGDIMGSSKNYTKQEYNIDLDQSGIAFAPIFGLDYKIGDFNFGAKYEFRAITTVENELNEGKDLTSVLPAFADGNTLRSDAPAKLSLGASWQIIPCLQIMGSWQYYFDKDAKVESLMDGKDNMKKLSRNTIEYNFGAELKLTKNFLISAGIQYSNYGINDIYTSDLAFINDSFMTGIGGKYSVNDKVDVNFGYCYANYAPDRDIQSIAEGLSTRYERKTHNVSVGVDFRL